MIEALNVNELLGLWERGQACDSAQWSLLALAILFPDTPPETLMNLSVGQRDAYLFSLRNRSFGPRVRSLVTCPVCNQQLELNFDATELGVVTQLPDKVNEVIPLSIEKCGYCLRFRLPNSQDMIEINREKRLKNNPERTREILLERCLISAENRADSKVVIKKTISELPADLVQSMLEEMDKADSLANINIQLRCPDCQHNWNIIFDIVTFFRQELNAWAQRILWQVYRLAMAYGWREQDILAMSAWRRHYYLELLNT